MLRLRFRFPVVPGYVIGAFVDSVSGCGSMPEAALTGTPFEGVVFP
jgi:hypothetical protein